MSATLTSWSGTVRRNESTSQGLIDENAVTPFGGCVIAMVNLSQNFSHGYASASSFVGSSPDIASRIPDALRKGHARRTADVLELREPVSAHNAWTKWRTAMFEVQGEPGLISSQDATEETVQTKK